MGRGGDARFGEFLPSSNGPSSTGFEGGHEVGLLVNSGARYELNEGVDDVNGMEVGGGLSVDRCRPPKPVPNARAELSGPTLQQGCVSLKAIRRPS